MLQHLSFTVPTPSEGFDIVVFSNRALFSYAFRKLIEESTNLKVSLLPVYAAYCSRLDQGFSGLLVVSLETTDSAGLEVLQYLRESLPLARVLVALSSLADVCTQDIQHQAHSIWSESSTILDLLEAAIITLKGGTWIEKQLFSVKLISEVKPISRDSHQEHGIVTTSQWKRLTDREIQILKLMSEGYSNQQIAERLFISISTVKNHSARLFTKLGIKNRTSAVLKAIESGILSREVACIS